MDKIEIKQWDNIPYKTPYAVIVNNVVVCICPSAEFARQIRASLEWAEGETGQGFRI